MKKKLNLNRQVPLFDRIRSGSRRYLSAVGVLIMTCMIGLLCAGADSAADNESQIEQTREALSDWVENQRLIAKQKQDLALAKEMLSKEVELVQDEITSLRDKIKETQGGIDKLDKNRAEKVKSNEALKEASESLKPILRTLEVGVKELLKKVPLQMADHVKPLSQQIPDDPEQTKLSIAQRFQNIVGILDQIDKFHRQISTFTEVQTLPDGSSVEVASVYIGIGQGYYASANGSVAGIGTATADGWSWTTANEVAPQILELIEILKNKKVAAYVQVPVDIQ